MAQTDTHQKVENEFKIATTIEGPGKRGALCCGSLEWDAVLEGFPEEVTFELGSKGWVRGSKERRGGKNILDSGNSICKCPVARGTKERSV